MQSNAIEENKLFTQESLSLEILKYWITFVLFVMIIDVFYCALFKVHVSVREVEHCSNSIEFLS